MGNVGDMILLLHVSTDICVVGLSCPDALECRWRIRYMSVIMNGEIYGQSIFANVRKVYLEFLFAFMLTICSWHFRCTFSLDYELVCFIFRQQLGY